MSRGEVVSVEQLDKVRLSVTKKVSKKRKSEFGQFMTPGSIARFMASLFPRTTHPMARLLDAGAGMGSLSVAFLERCANNDLPFQSVDLTAFEVDNTLRGHLETMLASYSHRLKLEMKIVSKDYINVAVEQIQFCPHQRFTHAILNPPYKKINSGSPHRLLLRQVGIETVNLYSAFVALSIELMEVGGYVVAIIPRSFCNGPYYRPFRELLLERMAIRQIHLFSARDKAFKDDDVLQENIILLLERGGIQGDVRISTSTDDKFTDYVANEYSFARIVQPMDFERFIHIPASQEDDKKELPRSVQYSLKDVGLEVSTGPVVDFRLKGHLRQMPESGSVPLLYPNHFSKNSFIWPKESKKPNAIMLNDDTKRWLFPNGTYVVIRRFSSKEEKRRVMANVVNPLKSESDLLGFENHLNVFHHDRQGLDAPLAQGLAVYLNSTAVDDYFRRFSGHTQVNATDLRTIKYPSRSSLLKLGHWALKRKNITQAQIDTEIERLDE